MGGTKFVLVVEDDDEIRSLIVSSLKAQIHAPTVRKSNDHLEGIMHAALTLTTGMSQVRIGLSFEREFLTPRLAELTVFDLSDAARFTEAVKPSSITFALSTDQGRVFVSALAPLRAKRTQA